MLGRERLRSRNSLEVLALLPRYDTARHGGKQTSDDDHTLLRRVLIWRVLARILAPLMPGNAEWDSGDVLADNDDDDDEEHGEYAYMGQQVLFGELRHVFVVPLLYIAGARVWVCCCSPFARHCE